MVFDSSLNDPTGDGGNCVGALPGQLPPGGGSVGTCDVGVAESGLGSGTVGSVALGPETVEPVAAWAPDGRASREPEPTKR